METSDRSPDRGQRPGAGLPVRAVLFDLGETLLRFGRLCPQTLFNQAARQSYDYLKGLGQPVGSYWRYWLVNWIGLRWNLLRSWIHKCDFDSLAVLRRHGEKKGFRLTDPQWLGSGRGLVSAARPTGPARTGPAPNAPSTGRPRAQTRNPLQFVHSRALRWTSTSGNWASWTFSRSGCTPTNSDSANPTCGSSARRPVASAYRRPKRSSSATASTLMSAARMPPE